VSRRDGRAGDAANPHSPPRSDSVAADLGALREAVREGHALLKDLRQTTREIEETVQRAPHRMDRALDAKAAEIMAEKTAEWELRIQKAEAHVEAQDIIGSLELMGRPSSDELEERIKTLEEAVGELGRALLRSSGLK